MDIELLKKELVRDERLMLKPYRDTVGKLTIGVGRNLDDVGINALEADFLLTNDINRVMQQLDVFLSWWRSLDPGRQRVMANMMFNMGPGRFLTFKETLKMIEAGRYEDASINMLKSKWASQVGPRAIRLSELMKKGE